MPSSQSGSSQGEDAGVNKSESNALRSQSAPGEAPTADWVDPAIMNQDPYPSYRRLRNLGPVVWVPAFNHYLVTTYAGCLQVEQHPEIFTSNLSGGNMVRALGGRPMLRKDDPEHAAERKTVNPTLRPKRMQAAWSTMFERNADRFLDYLAEVGPEHADLNRDFAAPYASKNLIDLLGLGDVDVESLRRWSLDFIAGTGNVLDDQEIWRRCETSQQEVDAVLDERIPYLSRHSDESMTSLMIAAGLSDSQIRSNVKLTISGGMNEPQHAITNIVWALSGHGEMRERAVANERLWPAVFEETVRWQSPIGMFPRETREATEIEGVAVPAGVPIGVVVASANRDSAQFSNAEDFDIDRSERSHLAFGSGAHMCAGRWAAKAAVANIGMPYLYRRFPDLRLDPARDVTWFGWVFRGITQLPVTWG